MVKLLAFKVAYVISTADRLLLFHKGEFQGIPPTDKSVNIRSADLYKFENGIITWHSHVVDRLNLMKKRGTLLSEHVKGELKDARVVRIPEFEESQVK
jgi:hypothetical protein